MDLEADENYLLTLDPAAGYDRSDKVMCCAYSSSKGILAAGTEAGNVALWRYDPLSFSTRSPELCWKLNRAIVLNGPVTQLGWSGKKDLLAANLVGEARLLSEQTMSSHCYQRRAAVQMGPSLISVTCFDPSSEETVSRKEEISQYELKTDIHVKGIFISKEFMAIWNGKQVVVYSYSHDANSPRAVGSFMTSSSLLALHEQTAFTVEESRVQSRTHKGTVKQLLTFTEHEGEPMALDINGDFLAIASVNGTIKVFNLSRSLDAKQVQGSPKSAGQFVKNFGGFATIRINCKGNAVSFTTKNTDGSMNSLLYVWSIETDQIRWFDFDTGCNDTSQKVSVDRQNSQQKPHGRVKAGAGVALPQVQKKEEEKPKDILTDLEKLAKQLAQETSGRFPAHHFWDSSGDARLIVCELHVLNNSQQNQRRNISNEMGTKIVTLFATPEHSLSIQDVSNMDPMFSQLIGMHVPFIYYLRKVCLFFLFLV